jgi:hypothetical protein
MDFLPTEDQAALLTALGKLLAQGGMEAAEGRRSFFDAALDAALADSGLLDAARIEGFGAVAAVLLVDQVARHPVIAEIGASALIRPLIYPDWPRPLAVIVGAPGRPARFLGQARSVLFLDRDAARVGRLTPGDVIPTECFFAYPMARLTDPRRSHTHAAAVGDATEIWRLLRLAIAAEIAGALQGALDCVTEHVKTRRMFGRQLGSFQAVQHRLASAATRVAACRLLALRAADSGRVDDSLTALGYAQDGAANILYDLHQFMGAMGLTLEHPLYRWSYRVKLLLSELGGAARQFGFLADILWGNTEDA